MSAALDRAVERMNRDAEERPYLVDKRLVTQLMLQFMTARDENPEVRGARALEQPGQDLTHSIQFRKRSEHYEVFEPALGCT